jgi:hypothetical protein
MVVLGKGEVPSSDRLIYLILSPCAIFMAHAIMSAIGLQGGDFWWNFER